jgi:hypothetical protein
MRGRFTEIGIALFFLIRHIEHQDVIGAIHSQ